MESKNEAQFRWPLVIILAVFFGSIMIYRFSNTLSTNEANTGKDVVSSSNTPAVTEADKVDFLHLEQQRELPTPGVTEVAPRIEAICISAGGKSSICIRGEFAHEGDIVDGFRILKIFPNKVEFEKNGKTVTGVFPPPKVEENQN